MTFTNQNGTVDPQKGLRSALGLLIELDMPLNAEKGGTQNANPFLKEEQWVDNRTSYPVSKVWFRNPREKLISTASVMIHIT